MDGTADTASLTLTFDCIRSGVVGVTATLSMVDDYTPVQISFFKVGGGGV